MASKALSVNLKVSFFYYFHPSVVVVDSCPSVPRFGCLLYLTVEFLETFVNKKDIQIVQCYVQYSKIENLWSSAGVANPDPGEQNFALTLIKHT